VNVERALSSAELRSAPGGSAVGSGSERFLAFLLARALVA
jgi:hypothetical protein